VAIFDEKDIQRFIVICLILLSYRDSDSFAVLSIPSLRVLSPST